MRLLELLIPSAKSRASIAKTEDASQISLKRIKEPLTSTFFLPNLFAIPSKMSRLFSPVILLVGIGIKKSPI